MTNEELAVGIQSGEIDYRIGMGELWLQTERFVERQARRLIALTGGMGGRVELGDLYDSGYFALVSAVESYNPAAGGSFLHWFAIHLKTAFAEAGGYRTERQRQEPLNSADSLDRPVGDPDDGLTVSDVVADSAAADDLLDVEERIWQNQLRAALNTALTALPSEEQIVLTERYFHGKTLNDLGGQKARTTSNRALAKLRRNKILRSFIELQTPYYVPLGVETFFSTRTSSVELAVLRREDLESSTGLHRGDG